MNERTNERTNERMNEWMDEWMNGWMVEWMKCNHKTVHFPIESLCPDILDAIMFH